MLRHGLRAGLVAVYLAAFGSAWGQARGFQWPDRDAVGRSAPIPFSFFHSQGLSYDRAVQILSAAGCLREDEETFTKFVCATAPKHWYLTREGRAEHPGIAVAASNEKGVAPIGTHIRALTKTTETVGAPSPDQSAALRAWSESLPIYRAPRLPLLPQPVDLNKILRNAPLSYASIQDAALTFDDVSHALEDARDCTAAVTASNIRFDCADSKTRWYLTPKGSAAHPGMALMFSVTNLGITDSDRYILGTMKSFQMLGGRDLAESNQDLRSWFKTLPEAKAVEMPPFPFSLVGSPLSEEEIRSSRFTYAAIMDKLTRSGCMRKEVDDYVAFTCQNTPMVFVLSVPGIEAYPAMIVAEPDPAGRGWRSTLSKQFLDQAKPPTELSRAALSRWSRGLNKLAPSQLY